MGGDSTCTVCFTHEKTFGALWPLVRLLYLFQEDGEVPSLPR